MEVTLDGDADAASLHAWANDALQAVADVHRLMSYQDPRSELSCLNGTAHRRPQPVHAWTRDVLRCALEIGARSGGAFDVAVRSGGRGTFSDIVLENDTVFFSRPLSVDLGGIAKGFAVDRAMDALADRPLAYACVNAGGDLRMRGECPLDLAIRDPRNPRGKICRVARTHPAAATSASYFRRGGDEILRPGGGAHECGASVTVFADTCMVADALTKVVILADPGTSARVLQSYGAAAVILDAIPA